MSPIFSTPGQLATIRKVLRSYLRLPFSSDAVPGAFMEAVLAHVRGGEVLATYDYVDVISRQERVGWSIKSTKYDTPLTWKRAKIENKAGLITASMQDESARQALGDEIIRFCNDHAHQSLSKYGLDTIGFARLIVDRNKGLRYFERELCGRDHPDIFDAADFTWRWSTQKQGGRKEQLSALHGFHVPTGERWWAWHGHGENQLHFTGERAAWWPPANDPHAIAFTFPAAADRLSLERLAELLDEA